MGKSTYVMGGGRSKRTCAFDVGGVGQIFAVLVRIYKFNDFMLHEKLSDYKSAIHDCT